MAEGLRFFDGFETDSTQSVWEADGLVRSTIHKRSGVYGVGWADLGLPRNQSPLCVPTTAYIVGMAFRNRIDPLDVFAGIWGGNVPILEIRGPGDQFHVQLVLDSQNLLSVWTQDEAGGWTARAYSTRQLDDFAFYYLEMACYAHDSNGRVVVQLNGQGGPVGVSPATIIDVSGIRTLRIGIPSVQKSYNQFHVGVLSGFLNEGRIFSFDDFYTRDANVVNEFLGDVEVVGTQLEDDFTVQWIRNSLTKNYLTLIEDPPDEDTTFVETDVAAKDLYEVQNSSFSGVIHAVQVVSRAKKTSTEIWRFHNLIHVGGLELNGPDLYMAYPLYETFPPDVFGHQPNGSDWTLGAFNAMKVGIYAESL